MNVVTKDTAISTPEELRPRSVNLEGMVIAQSVARSMRDEDRRHRRIADALQAGWEPIVVSHKYFLGLIPGGQSRSGFLRLPLAWIFLACSAGCALLVLVSWSFGLMMASEDDRLPTAVLAFLFGIFWLSVWCYIYSKLSSEMADDTYARSSGGSVVRTFNGPIPQAIWDKNLRERRLFDRTYIASPDPSAFSERRVFTGDPLLLGRIDDQFFLGGYWNFDDDLSHMDPENESDIGPKRDRSWFREES